MRLSFPPLYLLESVLPKGELLPDCAEHRRDLSFEEQSHRNCKLRAILLGPLTSRPFRPLCGISTTSHNSEARTTETGKNEGPTRGTSVVYWRDAWVVTPNNLIKANFVARHNIRPYHFTYEIYSVTSRTTPLQYHINNTTRY